MKSKVLWLWVCVVGLAFLMGCGTRQIKAPEATFPVFGPYMTSSGNMVKSPISWTWTGRQLVSSVTWNPETKNYTILAGGGNMIMAYRHHLLSEIFLSSSCSKVAVKATDGNEVWEGPLRAPEITKGDDGVWRIYVNAGVKGKGLRKIAVFKSNTTDSWSDYAFEGWVSSVPDGAEDPSVFMYDGKKCLLTREGGKIVVRMLSDALTAGKELLAFAPDGFTGSPFVAAIGKGRAGAHFSLAIGYDTAEGIRCATFVAAPGGILVCQAGRAGASRPPCLLKGGNGWSNPREGSSFLSPDGREMWLAYRADEMVEGQGTAAKVETYVCLEAIRADVQGMPEIGTTAGADVWRKCPSGEPPYQAQR